EPRHFAKRFPERPAVPVGIIHHQEGQSDDIQEVSQAQVKQEHGDAGEFPPAQAHGSQHPAIPQEAQYKHDAVDGGQELRCEAFINFTVGAVAWSEGCE
ncbi:hypothetical protein chiPu_0025362, partial [Chiloscyllium punctatum]|nr:hypothetical protein [Chiloscyllium punctatum]